MNEEIIIKIIILVLCGYSIISTLLWYIFFFKGYVAGFNKCKAIDDEILLELKEKKNENM